ncbi:uncharacterized protein A4U43_C08F19860 [Asparagus officinalis]|nr:uncharacterized protein A4U43_C08F19860 [Asparagus officinalis]
MGSKYLKQTNSIMRRVVQAVLPIFFILCLLVSYYDPFLHSLLYSIEFSYINQYIDRKSIFIFFNVILLFIARDSGLLSPSVMGIYDELVAMKASDIRATKFEGVEVEDITVVEEKLMIEKVSPLEIFLVEEEREELDDGCIEMIDEDLEVDELNRRCEEFIEKVKRERQMEAILFMV